MTALIDPEDHPMVRDRLWCLDAATMQSEIDSMLIAGKADFGLFELIFGHRDGGTAPMPVVIVRPKNQHGFGALLSRDPVGEHV